MGLTMKRFLDSLGKAIPQAAILFGVMVLVATILITFAAGLFLHFAIAIAIIAYTGGCYLWAFRHDKGFIVRRFKDIMNP